MEEREERRANVIPENCIRLERVSRNFPEKRKNLKISWDILARLFSISLFDGAGEKGEHGDKEKFVTAKLSRYPVDSVREFSDFRPFPASSPLLFVSPSRMHHDDFPA